MTNQKKNRTRTLLGIGLAYALSLLALPTCTGFFFALLVFKQGYLPIGLVALVDLVFSFVFLGKFKRVHGGGVSEGMQDAMKLNLLLGILAWIFYYMPTFGPEVGKAVQSALLLLFSSLG